MYDLRFAEGVESDFAALKARDRAIVLDAIERQLRDQPAVSSRNRKIVVRLAPPWDSSAPVWELRVGEYRVFYEVDEPNQRVVVRAVRRKPPHRTTEENL